jgi:hypothetical protein
MQPVTAEHDGVTIELVVGGYPMQEAAEVAIRTVLLRS